MPDPNGGGVIAPLISRNPGKLDRSDLRLEDVWSAIKYLVFARAFPIDIVSDA